MKRFWIIPLGAALVAAIAGLLWLGDFLSPLWAWLLAINAITFMVYAYDKVISKTERTRVPEVVLLGMAFIGGTAGAVLAMIFLRHKTAKRSFQLKFWGVVLLQVVLLVLYNRILT